MLRILRAFAWLRWRMFINSFERTGSRDTLERFSLAFEQLGPILALILIVPTAAVLAGVGLFAGMSLARGEPPGLPFAAARYMLLIVPALVIVGPFFLPAADRTNPVRLLLLPIGPSTLYVAQSSAAFGDPWNVLAIPLIGGLTAGVLAGGALTAGLLSLMAAVLLVVVLVGLSSIATSVLHLVVRDRRRGELIALLLIVVLPAISMLPAMLGSKMRRDRTQTRVERRVDPTMERARRAALSLVPSEMFVTATRGAVEDNYRHSSTALASLAAMAVLVHALGFVAFRNVLASPATSGARRGAPMRDIWTRRLPGLSPGASAVALAQLRLALRTPRGRSILLSPLVVFVVFGAMMYRSGGTADIGSFHFTSGITLATTACFFAVLSVLPIAMNQFAIDRAGLTLALLSPLSEKELLAGKAAGNALIVGPPALICILASRAVFPGDPFALWITLPIGVAAMYLLAAPIAAIASAMFPRVANLNSIGRGGNPHGLANLIGTFVLVAGGGIPLLLTLVATRLFERPFLAPVLVGTWCVVVALISRLLFIPAVRVFRQRRENFAMLEVSDSHR